MVSQLLPGILCFFSLGAFVDIEVKLPQPPFTESSMAEEFKEAVAQFNQQQYKDARSTFSKLRRKADRDELRDSLELCETEARAGEEYNEMVELMAAQKIRRALVAGEKALVKFAKTQFSEHLQQLVDDCRAALFFKVADFEQEGGKPAEPSEGGGDGDGDGGDGGDGDGGGADEPGEGAPRGRDLGGESGFGLNTRVVSGTPQSGRVAEGSYSLEWRTGRDLSFVNFDNVNRKLSDYYRYLNLSVCVVDGDVSSLRVLFDCDESPLNAGPAGGGGRGGRRGMGMLNRVVQRQGFHGMLKPTSRWKRVRLDLRKLENVGEVRWGDVRSLRIVHMPGGEGRVLLDDIFLEKE